MKKLFVLFFLVLFSFQMWAQTTPAKPAEETVSVPKSLLTAEQLQKIEVKTLMDKVEDPDKYNSIMAYGKAVGVAINDGLSAVVNQADKFGNTNVGQFTMYIIAFKVLGEKIFRMAGSLFFWLTGMTVLLFMRRKLLNPIRTVVKSGGWFKAKEYQTDKSPQNKWYDEHNSSDGPSPLAINTLLITGLTLLCIILFVA